jgi:hypothetical protein
MQAKRAALAGCAAEKAIFLQQSARRPSTEVRGEKDEKPGAVFRELNLLFLQLRRWQRY